MKVYYATDPVAGKLNIVKAVYDRDAFASPVTIGYAYGVLEIDEVDPDNKDICHDLSINAGKVDSAGEAKHYILIEANEPVLYKKENWEAVFDG